MAPARPLEVLTLPQPKRRDRKDGRRLTLSYVNFYIANGGVVMPAFADSAHKAAYKVVSAGVPGPGGGAGGGQRAAGRRRGDTLHHAAAAGGVDVATIAASKKLADQR